ncbi:MAG: CHAT domain-containing protein, partial [Acidobacteriota bacterium]
IEYVLTDSQVIVFVVTNSLTDGNLDIRAYPIRIAREDISRQISRFHWLMSNRHPSFHAEARALYDLLLKPAEAQLRGATAWCIVPDDILWSVPFQALQSRPLHYVIEDVALHYAPSLNVLSEISWREMRRATSLLALGNPSSDASSSEAELRPKTSRGFEPLPEAEVEVQSIGAGFQRSSILTGARATEAVFKAEAAGYSVIHLATHGVLDNLNPLYSYLLLGEGGGEDGLLEAREVFDLDLHANLIVLSACETARGRIGAGEGVIGMTWAFFAAGARSAVVSQWGVKSGTSSRQMISFYKHLGQGVGKAQALRQSSLEMLQGNQFSHPFYWASFVMVGSDR